MRMTPRPSAVKWGLLTLVCAAMAACGGDSGGGSGDSNGAASNSTSSNSTSSNATSSNSTGGASNGTTGAVCTDDDGCVAGQGCDTATGICRPVCTGDSDCDVTEVCTNGLCNPGAACTDASQCTGAGQVCNTCTGRCERAEAAGMRTCSQDSNCFIEEFCDTCRGICRELGGPCDPCSEDQECGAAGDLCLDFAGGGRFCAQACATPADCPRGFDCMDAGGNTMQCVPRSGDCSDPGECAGDDDCPAGEQCNQLLACVPGCTEGTCPNGEVCDNGACKPPCVGDAECPEGSECTEDGLCRVPGGCLTSRDCPDPGTYCDVEMQMCVPGCGADEDCAGLQVCRNNVCGPRPCDGNYLCGFGQVCDIDTGSCVMPEGPYCEMCDAEAENQCGGEPNFCLRLQDEEGNPAGDFCGVGCDPTDLDACPVGYGCQELMDQNMQTVGHVCFRACNRDPI